MFKDNKYTRWYNNIINFAKSQDRNKIEKKYEAHHIIPNSIKKNKDTVLLTPKEHFICHKLLLKMVNEKEHKKKMRYALWMMSNSKKYKVTARLYESLRKQHALQVSIDARNRRYKRNAPAWNKGKKLSKDHIQKLKQNHKGMLGKHHSIESKKKIGNANSIKLTEYHKNKIQLIL